MVGTKLSKSCCKSPRKVCSVAFPSLYLWSMLSIYCSNVIYSFNFCQSVGKKQLFWFFTHVTSIFIGVRDCFAFQRWSREQSGCRQKPNVLFVRWVFVCRTTSDCLKTLL